MKVVCLWTGNKYGSEYPERLYRGLKKYATISFNFEIRARSRFPGWWGKIEWFPPKERIVVLDLDVVITDNVDFLFKYDGPFCVWRDPWKACFNSSVMSIAPGFGKEIQEKFDENPFRIMRTFYGDQEFISTVARDADTWQEFAPGKVKSFKADELGDGPGGAAICVFHGNPKPSDFPPDHWVSRAWTGRDDGAAN